jgi:hypothetical protein
MSLPNEHEPVLPDFLRGDAFRLHDPVCREFSLEDNTERVSENPTAIYRSAICIDSMDTRILRTNFGLLRAPQS